MSLMRCTECLILTKALILVTKYLLICEDNLD